MTGIWEGTDRSARLTRRSELLATREVELVAAQKDVNFVVFAPTEMPAGTDECRTWLRPEQPPGRPGGVQPQEIGQSPWSDANPCSLRTVWRGGGRSIRMKQFLYDWAPAAGGVAPLWDSSGIRARVCGRSIAFVGEDYRKKLGACADMDGTQVELSVIDGHFEDDELVGLLGSLRVATEKGAQIVRNATFHERNYWVRYRCRPYRVPYGMWQHKRRRPYDDVDGHVWVSGQPVRWPVEVDIPHATAASAFVLPDEVEVVARMRNGTRGFVFLISARVGSPGELGIPPEPETHPAERRERQLIRGRECWIAAASAQFGGWECWWKEGGWTFGLWTTPSERWSESAFTALVESLHTHS